MRCDKCEKEFNTEQGLQQHNADKHGLSKHENKKMKRQEQRELAEESGKKDRRKMQIKYAAILLVVVAIVVSVYIMFPKINYVPLTEYGEHSLGAADASITMTEYSDFECPFCGRFVADTEPDIIRDYVNNGTVRLVFKNFPLASHRYAQKAAEAAECAADQGKFWEMHDKMFANSNNLYVPSLKSYAESIGLDMKLFNDCLDSGVMAERISRDMQEATKRGVSSTPTFFINDIQITGAKPLSDFVQAINAAS